MMTNTGITQAVAPAQYEKPTITVMTDEEVLRAFQMTAAQIGAAAVWWSATCSAC
jgi:hypothetical protein